MKRIVDRSKKSNIKCEHCKHWNRNTQTVTKDCTNTESVHYDQYTWYYQRCKWFEWAESENKR